MRQLILIIFTLVTCSCTICPEFQIDGTVHSDELEGINMYLVPMGKYTIDDIDSCTICNRHFSFTGKEEKLAIIRVAMSHRFGCEELLVVTEPGTIYVDIDSVSHGCGTPQNDSLQTWKDLVRKDQERYSEMSREGNFNQRDSIHNLHKLRTREMAHNIGDSTTLGRFLLKLYPLETVQ